MTNDKSGRGNDLRLLVCGAGSAIHIGDLVREAVKRGWDVDITATAAALTLIDAGELQKLSGRPLRTTYEYAPDGTRISPKADALIVAPATFNTVNKLALGVADTYPLSSVAEVIGRRVPTVIVPSVNAALASRRPYQRAVRALQEEDVVFAGDGLEALEKLPILRR
ncbi:flavoprotein [Actinoplanes sp. TFC3]|uniref:flavoprotein n=1 Tax=Actinoplanes sp. TFC3 TaxID=1710355 RepID=UPI000836F877|nr:flavoprotein [Actinoplanes sp. TFC3]